jgi:hypothetical protein
VLFLCPFSNTCTALARSASAGVARALYFWPLIGAKIRTASLHYSEVNENVELNWAAPGKIAALPCPKLRPGASTAYDRLVPASVGKQALVTQLHQLLAARVKDWSDSGYPSAAYPALAEILENQVEIETGAPRFLRLPQLRALETYWYLRLVADALRGEMKATSRIRESLVFEADKLRAEIEHRAITEAQAQSILAQAAAIRDKLRNPTSAQKRALFDVLDFEAVFRVDDTGRWCDVSCGLTGDEIIVLPLSLGSFQR